MMNTARHSHAPKALREPTRAVLEGAALLFKAAGDPERLRVLALLGTNELCVSEIAEYTGEGVSTVSQRLKLLQGAQLVQKRRDGKHIYYSLADNHVRSLVTDALHHAGENTGAVSPVRKRRTP